MKENFYKGIRVVKTLRADTVRDRITGNTYYTRTTTFIKERPLVSFLLSLVLLFVVIFLGSFIGKNNTPEKKTQITPKSVQTFNLGTSPQVSLQAKVQKAGVVKIVAQTAGVVGKISVHEGDDIKQGTCILQINSNYQGGNAAAIQTSIAQAQYQNVLDTYGTQKDLLNKQRDIANKSNENTSNLRQISEAARNDTGDILNANEAILATLREQLAAQIASGATEQQTLQTRQVVAQAQAGLAQIRSSYNNLNYQVNESNPPTELANIQREIALKQLDVQDKALDLNKKVSGLQVSLAAIGESLTHPATPFAGTVEKVSVKEGDVVSPGTVLAIISSSGKQTTLTANVAREIAQSVSKIEPSKVHIQRSTFSLVPTYVSQEATEGELYSVTYALPAEYASAVTDAEFVTIDMPIGYTGQTTGATPYIPIDAVFQTQDEAYVNVVNGGVAQSKKITLGDVYGKYVEVLSGLERNDKVILDRNVLAGDQVKVQ